MHPAGASLSEADKITGFQHFHLSFWQIKTRSSLSPPDFHPEAVSLSTNPDNPQPQPALTSLQTAGRKDN